MLPALIRDVSFESVRLARQIVQSLAILDTQISKLLDIKTAF